MRADAARQPVLAVLVAILAILLAAGALIAIGLRHAGALVAAARDSNDVVAALFDLDELAGEWFARPGPRPLEQWRVRSAELAELLARLPRSPESERLAAEARALDDLFRAAVDGPPDPRRADVARERLLSRAAAMVVEAHDLHRDLLDQRLGLFRLALTASAAGVGALLAAVATATALYLRGARALAARGEQLERANAGLVAANAELEQFAYVASHDLREPLRMIALHVQLLRRELQRAPELSAPGARALKFIDEAESSTRRLARLVEDLLVYTRVGERRALEPVAAGEVAREVVSALAGAIAEAGASVEVGALPEVRCERTKLALVLQNLIANAVKFRAPGTAPRVAVTAERDGDGWRFAVRDDGIGIEPQHAATIFAPFRRLHGRDAYPGTGIGLAISHKIVVQRGGRIWVEPAPGGGSVFRFTVPDRAPDAGSAG